MDIAEFINRFRTEEMFKQCIVECSIFVHRVNDRGHERCFVLESSKSVTGIRLLC